MMPKHLRTLILVLSSILVGILALIGASAALSQGEVSNQLTYQGTLFESGVPVSGVRDMTFRLYTDDLCTVQSQGLQTGQAL